MGCAVSRLRSGTPISVRNVEELVHTGDLILFSSKHGSSHVTKCFTASEWDHVGVVVKLSARQVFILEYAGGVYLYPLFTRLYTYFAVQGRAIVLRRLSLGRDRAELQARVESFVRGVLGQKPPSIEEIVMAVLKQEALLSAFISKLRGGAAEDDLSSLFCSKLVAAVYKDVGLIGSERAAGDFLPKHFSGGYDGFLDLQGGAVLGAETPISFDSVEEEIANLRQQMAQQEAMRPEVAVRLVSGLYLAARELGSEISASLSRLAPSGRSDSQPDPPPEPRPPARGTPPARRAGGAYRTPTKRGGPTIAAVGSPVSASGGVALDAGPVGSPIIDEVLYGAPSPPPRDGRSGWK